MLSQENEKLEGKLGKEKEKVAKAKEMLRAAQAEREEKQEAAARAEVSRARDGSLGRPPCCVRGMSATCPP